MIPATLSRRGGGALLDLAIDVPPSVDLFGETWPAKAEFHVTLLGSDRCERLGDVVSRAADGIEFGVSLRDEYWRLDENEARTIIQLCAVGGAEEYFSHIERYAGAVVVRPPFHVTLFAINTEKGIGLASPDDLRAFGRRISGADHVALVRELGGSG